MLYAAQLVNPGKKNDSKKPLNPKVAMTSMPMISQLQSKLYYRSDMVLTVQMLFYVIHHLFTKTGQKNVTVPKAFGFLLL